VHFAAIPSLLLKPDNQTFSVNAISTYNVIEAAVKLGIRKVIIASSETTYGVCFAEGDKDFHSFPLEEDYDVDPMDSYGLSKVVNEKTARAFAMRSGIDIYACGSPTSSSRMNTSRFPATWPIRRRASATPGATSMPAISARSLTFACRPTASASRSSTPSTTRSRPASRRAISRPLGAEHAHPPGTRRIRSAPLQPQDPRGSGLFKEEHNWRKYVPACDAA
jgi:hypothetical protein